MFGANIVYGMPIYFTISPNERHSALVLRLSRCRKCDTLFTSLDNEVTRAQYEYAGMDRPSLFATENSDLDCVTVDLPSYDIRLAMLAKDNLSIVDAFNVQVRFLFCGVYS